MMTAAPAQSVRNETKPYAHQTAFVDGEVYPRQGYACVDVYVHKGNLAALCESAGDPRFRFIRPTINGDVSRSGEGLQELLEKGAVLGRWVIAVPVRADEKGAQDAARAAYLAFHPEGL